MAAKKPPPKAKKKHKSVNHLGPSPSGEGLGWGFAGQRKAERPHPAATRQQAAKSRCPSPEVEGFLICSSGSASAIPGPNMRCTVTMSASWQPTDRKSVV